MPIEFEMVGVGVGNKSKGYPDMAQETIPADRLKLQSALGSGSENEYKQALLLEKLRDALLEQTKYLMEEVNEDINKKSRSLAPRIHGWKNEDIPGLSADLRRKKTMKVDHSDYESAWENLRGLETQSYQLEDPGIANDFFQDIQDMLINDGLKGVQQKHLVNYPWLLPRSKQIFSHPLLAKKKKNFVMSKVEETKLPKKTISQQRLEKDLEEKEIELRKIQSIKFQANPIPASSLIPKYKDIIQKHGTKSMEKRQKANLDYIAKMEEEKKRAEEAGAPKRFTAKLNHHHGKEDSAIKPRRKNTIPSEDECTFKPKISQGIPDFKRVQEEFEQILENSRSQKSTTIPVPFAMLSRVRKVKRSSSSSIEEVATVKNPAISQVSSLVNHQAHLVAPKTTRTTQLKLQCLQDQKEAAELVALLEEEQKRVIEEKKRAAAERIRMRLTKATDKSADRQEKLKRHQEYQKSLEKSFEEKKAEMKQRIDSRRTLFERVQLDAARNQARSKVNMVLAAAGVDLITL